jgi:hypothetical protein
MVDTWSAIGKLWRERQHGVRSAVDTIGQFVTRQLAVRGDFLCGLRQIDSTAAAAGITALTYRCWVQMGHVAATCRGGWGAFCRRISWKGSGDEQSATKQLHRLLQVI